MIDSYQFGEIVIKGKKYTSDLVILPDRVKSHWWKKEGHRLCVEDLKEIMQEKPEILIIGTGSHGGLRVPHDVKDYVERHGVTIISQATDDACLTFNQLCSSQKVVAALHLTC